MIEAEYRRTTHPEIREVIQRILGRVRGALLVHETAAALTGPAVELTGLLRTITGGLKTIYSPRRRLPVVVEGDDTPVPTPVGMAVAVMAKELVTNCFLHAFPQQRFGEITLRHVVRGGALALTICDDGVGLAAGHAAGRGMTLVRELAASCGGEAVWLSAGAGTRVEIRLPLGGLSG